MEQLRSAHSSSLAQLESSHNEALDASRKSFEKQLASLNLELKATQDDLAKAKQTVGTLQSESAAKEAEIERLKGEVESAKSTTAAESEKDVQIAALRKQLEVMADDLEATKMASEAQKESLREMTESHQRDLEEAAKSRVEAVQALKEELEQETNGWAAEKAKLTQDLEDERVAKERAKAEAQAAQTALRTPPMSPKVNGQPSQMVPRDELLKAHEAHSAKMDEVNSSHLKMTEALTKEVEELKSEVSELKNNLSSKTLELKFLGDEKQELEEELER